MAQEADQAMSEDRVGRCYELAFNHVAGHVFRNEAAWLIHGLVRSTHLLSQPAVICHAWVEKDGMVWEPITETAMPAEAFMRLFDATEIHRYSAEEAGRLGFGTGHSGPWDEMPEHLQRTLVQIEEEARA